MRPECQTASLRFGTSIEQISLVLSAPLRLEVAAASQLRCGLKTALRAFLMGMTQAKIVMTFVPWLCLPDIEEQHLKEQGPT